MTACVDDTTHTSHLRAGRKSANCKAAQTVVRQIDTAILRRSNLHRVVKMASDLMRRDGLAAWATVRLAGGTGAVRVRRDSSSLDYS